MENNNRADIGLIGLAVMGQNIVLNMERNGFVVAVYNRTTAVTREFIDKRAQGKNVLPAYESIEEFIGLLSRPRKVMLMVMAGVAVDAVIQQVKPFLDNGDLIVDGGNSDFKDTIRRERDLGEEGILFIGTGVSGGEEGALYGPSIMPGGSRDGYALVEDIFTSIAAEADGEPCCIYIGRSGAGHFVKMVHNGIEYGDMELIAEAYHLLKDVGLVEHEISDIFARWNKGRLDSYLMEITSEVLKEKDAGSGEYLVTRILDTASHKGTGVWTVIYSLELGVPAPTIYAAVDARLASARREERRQLAQSFPRISEEISVDRETLITRLESAIYAAIIASYAQGMHMIQASSSEFGFGDLDIGGIAKIWRAGSILRARFLDDIAEAYRMNRGLINLIQSDVFAGPVKEGSNDLAWITSLARSRNVPTPALDASFSYFLSATSAELPGASLVQGQRDFFGAHTYQRKDREGVFHMQWMEDPRVEEVVK